VEARIPLPKAFDFPLPVPVLVELAAPAPVHQERAAIPESMRSSPPIARPVVVTVNPAQMMPVSAPQSQPVPQQFSEPISMSEDTARARLMESVAPAYPQEGLAQKLHGAVVLRAIIARDGSVEDLKIVQGYFVLGRAAIAAVKQWRFQPYTAGGHAVSTQTQITINFSYPPG
jgi:TonB family protein